MIYGRLIYSEAEKRLDILSENHSFYGGLHCGECIDVLINEKWHPTRVEFNDDWYLFELFEAEHIPSGLEVRIEA